MDNATTQLQFYLHSSWASSVPGRCTCIWTNAITAHGKLQDLRPNGFTEETVISDYPVRDKIDLAHPPPQMAYTRGEKLHGWYKTVNRCTMREVKSARDAPAESLNSKMKAFRAQLRGVSNLPFFMYRLSTIFG